MSKYSDLRTAYGGFTVPAYKVFGAGSELSRSEFMIDGITVDNGMGKTAGACAFTVHDVYEHGSGQFSQTALDKLKPGSRISLSLGYGSSVSEVFSGYVDELAMRFDGENICLSAVCLDARALMRLGARYTAAKGKTVQNIAESLLDLYSPLVSAKEVTLAALEKEVCVTQAGGDLDFIQDAADLRGHYFYIDCGKAYVGGAKDTVCVEFDWPDTELELGARYVDLKITGMGYDHAKMEEFSSQKDAKGTQKNLLAVTRIIPLPPHLLGDAGKAVVAAAADAAKREAVAGRVYCRGIPEVKLGQKIKINKCPFAALTGDRFTVVSVHHRMNSEDGFVTEIGIGG
ncbi:MAG: hypothetical protein LBR85_00515 [Oscillospiraceae bacterium]|jgi:hypothetical protein|nr:hypothetical protein [Oscillospiraceae bacterium]